MTDIDPRLKADYDRNIVHGDPGAVLTVDPTEQEIVLTLDDGGRSASPTPTSSP